MLKNYLKIAWRNLINSKAYSSINIIGLAMGMAIALLIGLWIADEISFDSYHSNHERLAKVMLTQVIDGEYDTGPTIAVPLAQALRSRYADDLKRVSLVSNQNNHLLAIEDKKIPVKGIWVQHEFPEMFTFRMTRGNAGALKDPSSILVAQSLATALFGDTDPVNKSVRLDNKVEMKIGGVYEDLPVNTTFYNTTLLLPWENKENGYLNTNPDWQNHNNTLYVELTNKANPELTTARIKNTPTPYIKDWHEEIMLQPLDKLHLYSEFEKGKAVGGRIQFVWLFGIIGGFVLLLACINFMNLATARSEKRAKEVGIRKTVGSLRKQLIGQFLSESIVVAFIALMVAIALVQLSLPFFNELAAKQMTIPWNNYLFWLLILAFTLFTGIISGSYPAFYLSSFEPIKVLKGIFRSGRYASLPRKALVVVQFSVSLTLIIGTVIVYRQIQFAKDRPIGYSREGLITIGINSPELERRYDALRTDLLQTGVVNNMAESSQSTTRFNNNNSLDWKGKDPKLVVFFRNVNVTPDFGNTIGWTVKEGRDFSRSFATDSSAMILTEAAVKVIGIPKPVGEMMTFDGKQRLVIGVVEDLVTNSPYDPATPAIFLGDGDLSVITIRMKTGIPVTAALESIKSVFKKYNPSSPFAYQFNDDDFARKFAAEERIGNLATVFAVFAIFISCLGLFGLASFVAEQRTKEIGVRKILGANLFSLWALLSKDFVKLAVISLFISIPLTHYGMNQWLLHYTYRTGIPWWVFATAGLGLIIITLMTVSYQSLRAAMRNPVKSLRTE